MFTRIKLMLIKKYILGYLVQGYSKVKGYKTQIIAAIACAVWGADVFGYITPEQAEQFYAALGGSGAITILQKLQRWQTEAEELANLVKMQGDPK